MPWQRAGTVSVQANSTTVTGVNVDFAANSRVGDSFIGPDGFSYEVSNVASATVISILPPYKGPTVSGAAYAIMPVQGYDKMLSDAFNNLNNQFGPKLAALGTTGNYDILPVSKGGTGANTAEGARTALGLTLQSSLTDPTPNVLMKNGAWSWGAPNGNIAADLNAINVSQAVGINNNTANTPTIHGSTNRFAAGSMGIALVGGSNQQQQLVFSRTGSQIVLRRKNSDVWQPDDYLCIYPTGQTFLSIAQGGTGTTTGISDAAQTALNTKFDAAKAVLDPQSAGGLMSYTSNATGQIWKFLNGMMITSQTFTGAAGDWAVGAAVRYKDYSATFPAAFLGAPKIYATMVEAQIATRGAWIANVNGTASAWQAFLCSVKDSTNTAAVSLNILAIGTWK